MKLNDHFILQEYVPKATFDAYPAHICQRFVDERILDADTQLKLLLESHYGKSVSITINNWYYGGVRQFSGYRPPNLGPGNESSAHKLGKASDKQFKFKDSGIGIPIKQVYDLVRLHHHKFFELGIRRIEDIRDTPTWLHWDCAYTGENTIQIVRP
jgi:hypothetical protein